VLVPATSFTDVRLRCDQAELEAAWGPGDLAAEVPWSSRGGETPLIKITLHIFSSLARKQTRKKTSPGRNFGKKSNFLGAVKRIRTVRGRNALRHIKKRDIFRMISKNQKTDAAAVKQLAASLGADLCGIAPVNRFDIAPAGFRPVDIYKRTKSVIVFAKRLPTEILFAESCIPYTQVNALIAQEVDRLSLSFSLALQDRGIRNVMVPTDDPYESWDEANKHGQAILSMRHAAMLAGLGKLGRNNLLINKKYGNMIQIGAILADGEFDYDEIAEYEVCIEGCSACLDVCPQKALDGTTVDQSECRKLANYKNEKGYMLKRCWKCRSVCPQATGIGRQGN
jgi:epoxyqueuosine reductase